MKLTEWIVVQVLLLDLGEKLLDLHARNVGTQATWLSNVGISFLPTRQLVWYLMSVPRAVRRIMRRHWPSYGLKNWKHFRRRSRHGKRSWKGKLAKWRRKKKERRNVRNLRHHPPALVNRNQTQILQVPVTRRRKRRRRSVRRNQKTRNPKIKTASFDNTRITFLFSASWIQILFHLNEGMKAGGRGAGWTEGMGGKLISS